MALHSLLVRSSVLVLVTTGILHQALPSATSGAFLELNGTLGLSCEFDHDCLGNMACVRLTSRCGCPLDNPVLVRGGHGGLRCAPSRALWQPCGWHEQCAAVDPGLVCVAGFCRCLRGGSKLCAIRKCVSLGFYSACGSRPGRL
ncbi:hypothetical protein IscW_ISCW010200 [Ixodes scapularis]|uniref:Uncharacterized protein n=1 Tax=Ixodes scapularis TaxID=6945 RepID=B7PYQ0_IXOSC|nr:hypothetical protein IscW_ISCW010200 [Ixodes scapularis]|eukprot:XP_002403608.1 hypothetical protein IscW_ISCW010200 [Ixodes scapularis]